jgi:hypothetical protein
MKTSGSTITGLQRISKTMSAARGQRAAATQMSLVVNGENMAAKEPAPTERMSEFHRDSARSAHVKDVDELLGSPNEVWAAPYSTGRCKTRENRQDTYPADKRQIR